MYMSETSCMKGPSVHVKDMWMKQLCNHKVWGFATAFRVQNIFGTFEKRPPKSTGVLRFSTIPQATKTTIAFVAQQSVSPDKHCLFVQEMTMLESQNELSHGMLIRHHECTQDLEFRHLNAVHRLRRDQQQNQHQTEYTSQVDYNRRLEMELRKKHLFELKMQPKTLKVKWSRVFESVTTKVF